MQKIVVCGLIHERNLGDPVIVAAARKLVEDAIPDQTDSQIVAADLLGRAGTRENWGEKRLNPVQKLPLTLLGAVRRVSAKLSEPLGRKVAYARWRLDPNGRKRLKRYFKEKLEGARLAVVAGGGLIEYCSHEYNLQLSVFIEAAQEAGVSVTFNSVGIVGVPADRSDWRYRMMRDALNAPAVRRVTVRDDVRTMNEAYMRPGHVALRSADPGVWIADILGKKKAGDADVIGLGLIRNDAFTDYGIRFDEEDLISLWVGITRELDRRGLRWKFFCNGYEKDYALGLKILERLGVADTQSLLMERPTEYEALIDTIGSFRAVICHRLHACIISYALDIPCVALSWNRKLQFFFEAVGCPERVFEAGQFDAGRIVDALERALGEGYDAETRQNYMADARANIEEAVKLADLGSADHKPGSRPAKGTPQADTSSGQVSM